MAISTFFAKTATVKRLTADATYTKKRTYQTQSATVSVSNPMPFSSSTEAIGAGIPSKSYAVYCASDAGIVQTDELTIDSVVYKVQEIENWTFGGIAYKKLVVVKQD